MMCEKSSCSGSVGNPNKSYDCLWRLYSGVYGQALKALHMRVTGVTIWDLVITYPCQAGSLQHTLVLITLDDLLTLLASSLPATDPAI